MGQPVKLSDSLILDARLTSKVSERSIAGQIEFWAQLGKAMEPLLRGNEVLALRRSGQDQSLSACLESVDSEVGYQRVADYLDTRPFPHYEPSLDQPGLLVRTDADGSKTLGCFIKRQFQSVE